MLNRFSITCYKIWNMADYLHCPEQVWTLLEMGCMHTALKELIHEFFRELFAREPWMNTSLRVLPCMLKVLLG